MLVRLRAGDAAYSQSALRLPYSRFTRRSGWRAIATQEDSMNTIIYIVGLVVIIGFILSYFR